MRYSIISGRACWMVFGNLFRRSGAGLWIETIGKDQQVPLMDGSTNAPKAFTLTLDGQSINTTGSCSSQNCPTIEGVQIWIESSGQKNYYKDGQRLWTADDTVNLIFAAAAPLSEGLNVSGAAKDVTKMFGKTAAAETEGALKTAVTDAAIKDAESGAGAALREPLANQESRGVATAAEAPRTEIKPEQPLETGSPARTELPSKGEAPRTDIATDARPETGTGTRTELPSRGEAPRTDIAIDTPADAGAASQQGAMSRAGAHLGNEAIAQADAAAAEQAMRDAELLTGRTGGAAARADLNASGASAGSDVLKAAQNAEARALSETMSRIKSAAADQPARDTELLASRATTGAGRTGASSPEAALTGDAVKGAPKLNGSALDSVAKDAEAAGQQLARDIEGAGGRKPAVAEAKPADISGAPGAGGEVGDRYRPLRGLSADAASDDLPAGFRRVVDKETGDIKFRGPDGKVYDNIPKDIPKNVPSIPKGLSDKQFADFSSRLRTLMSEEGLPPGDTFVHGSRASGAAATGADIDIVHVVSEDAFDAFVKKRVAETPGGSGAQIADIAAKQGRVRARGVSRTFEQNLWQDLYPSLTADEVSKIQFSIVKPSSPFNVGPFVPIR